MSKNKKISLGIAAAMVLSIFLPFVKLGILSMSLFDVVQLGESPELILLLVLIVAFGVLAVVLLLIGYLYARFREFIEREPS